MARIVARIRARWPAVEIVLRADSGFAREELMAWCEENGVDYVFGLARNVNGGGIMRQSGGVKLYHWHGGSLSP